MNKIITALTFILIAAPAFALKDCEELKSEIAAKIEANGGKDYQLEIVAAENVGNENVVGSCEGGKKKISYKKGDRAETPNGSDPSRK